MGEENVLARRRGDPELLLPVLGGQQAALGQSSGLANAWETDRLAQLQKGVGKWSALEEQWAAHLGSM